MDDDAGLADRLAEMEGRRSEVEALPAELNKGAAGRRRGRQGTRAYTRRADDEAGRQASTWPDRRPGRRVTTQAGR